MANAKYRYQAAYVNRLRAAGLCPHCGKLPVQGRSACQDRLDAIAANKRKWYRKNKRSQVW